MSELMMREAATKTVLPPSQSARRARLFSGVLGIALFSLLGTGRESQGADNKLVYVTPRGVTMTVTEKGLSTIRKGFGSIIDGGWSAFNAETRFKDGGTGEVQIPPPSEMSITVVSPKEAEVRHQGGDVVCLYRYLFDGDDVLISCRVENHHPTASLKTIGFSGLAFHFARPPEGVMPVEAADALKERGLAALHPSPFSPIGGGYAVDKNVGIGISPANSRAMRTLFLWDYANWDDLERDRVLERNLHYIVYSPIAPGGAMTAALTIRITPELEWKYLMEPYRAEFLKIHGPVKYAADGRWIATDNLAESEKPESSRELRRVPNRRRDASETTSEQSDRPSGRGIDRSQGAQAVCDALIPRLMESAGQGALLRGYGLVDGVDETGLAEFNILPPEVEENWERIIEQFSAARFKFGVATSPLQVKIRTSWTDRQPVRLDPRDPEHRELIWNRYDQMIQRGCTLFTLENFGGSLEDVELMEWLREKMGPEIAIYVDRPCDAVLVYAGGYSPATLKTGSSAGLERGYRLAFGEETWEICQWLAPGAQMAGRLTEIEGNLNDALETPERYFYSRHIVPMLPVADFKRAPAIKKLQPLYVQDDGTWLPSKGNNR